MKDAFQELVDSLKKNLEKCPWGKELTVDKIMKECLKSLLEKIGHF